MTDLRLEYSDIKDRCHWLKQALAEDRELAPSIEGDVRTDVCIVGGGFLGLWTAIRLKEADPSLDVLLLEADICGAGPSGRNSGMALGLWAKFAGLSALCGEEEALRLARLSVDALGEIDAFCRANGIDPWFERRGWLWGATCERQVGAWNDSLERLARHGWTPARPLGREEIAGLTGSSSYLAGVLDETAATIQPAFLVRGLRRVAIGRGVRVCEKTPMLGFSRGAEALVKTPRAMVHASQIVLAVNAWSASIPELAPSIFVIASDDFASRPMREQLEAAGLWNGPYVIDSRVFVSGYRTTRDGRLVGGVTGGAIGFGGVIDRRFQRGSPRLADFRRSLGQGHPALAGFELEDSWNGPIDRTASGLPLFGRLGAAPKVLYGYGFSGNGIVPTFLGGRILSSLVLEKRDEWSGCGLVRPVRREFPREPLRFVGAHLVRGAVRRRDRLEHEGRPTDSVTEWIAGLAPSGVTPSRANLSPRE